MRLHCALCGAEARLVLEGVPFCKGCLQRIKKHLERGPEPSETDSDEKPD